MQPDCLTPHEDGKGISMTEVTNKRPEITDQNTTRTSPPHLVIGQGMMRLLKEYREQGETKQKTNNSGQESEDIINRWNMTLREGPRKEVKHSADKKHKEVIITSNAAIEEMRSSDKNEATETLQGEEEEKSKKDSESDMIKNERK